MADCTFQRAWKDTERFRNLSSMWFWGVEVFGSGILSALTAYFTFGISNITKEQAVLITFGIFVIGFFVVYALIYFWNLFRAPYRQRNEAYCERDKALSDIRSIIESGKPFVRVVYVESKWGHYYDSEYKSQALTITATIIPNKPLQFSGILLKISNDRIITPEQEVRAFYLQGPENHVFRFDVGEMKEGNCTAILDAVVAGQHWESDSFVLDVPPFEHKLY